MKTEKSFLDKEREREWRLVNCDESWWSRIRRFFTRTREDPVRTLADECRDDINNTISKTRNGYTYNSFSTDVYTKAILDYAKSERNLTEYVWDTISDEPTHAGVITMKKLAADTDTAQARVNALATEQMYREALKAMRMYGRKD